MKDVTISADYYLDLIRAELILAALEAGGVDNWDWYGDSVDTIRPQLKRLNRLILEAKAGNVELTKALIDEASSESEQE
jgi:hypothetical protein